MSRRCIGIYNSLNLTGVDRLLAKAGQALINGNVWVMMLTLA